MTISDMEKLLKLKGWTKRELARRLDLGENIVYRWFDPEDDRKPTGPAGVLMKMWLEDAKQEKQRIAHAS